MAEETVKLRGHHFLCMLGYIGNGYTPDFVANFDTIAERINRGAKIEIVSGVDEICQSLQGTAAQTCAHAKVCHRDRVKLRDVIALQGVARELQWPTLKTGDKVSLGRSEVTHLRRKFNEGAVRHACLNCHWFETCSQIAASGFAQVKLLPQAIPL